MIELENHIKSQLNRLRSWLGFPTTKEGIRDLVAALEVAGSEEIVTAVLDDIVATVATRECPAPAVFRGKSYELREKYAVNRSECHVCRGVGYVTIFQLVTYSGNTLTVRSRETLDDVQNQEQADDFARRIQATSETNPHGNQQTVLSAARRCRCNPRAAA